MSQKDTKKNHSPPLSQEWLDKFASIDPQTNDFKNTYQSECVRKKGNFGPKNANRFLFDSVERGLLYHSSSNQKGGSPSSQDDSEDYDDSDSQEDSYEDSQEDNLEPILTEENLTLYSPKLLTLIREIEKQDAHDKKKYGKTFKHFIFSDIKSGTSGTKIIATALIDLLGLRSIYEPTFDVSRKKWSKISLRPTANLTTSKNDNFALLTSVSVFQQNLSLPMRKEILQRYNERPDNIYGKNIRIIIMDSGFKEGIDLFDVKYVHIYEPQVTLADQRQVIGRGTRTCGQKGLPFHPTQGWPLYVNLYDSSFPEETQYKFMNTETVHQLFLRNLGLDIRLLNLFAEMERVCIQGSIDYDLNKNIHEFSIAHVDSRSQTGGRPSRSRESQTDRTYTISSPRDSPIHTLAKHPLFSLLMEQAKMPDDYEGMRNYIRRYFGDFYWKHVRLENQCGPAPEPSSEPSSKSPHAHSQTGGSTLVDYTPTQDFIRHYFTPANTRKGMLLWASVGTGKTCSAIATATTSFEKKGYTILWVTRTTLKNDIWKNMFDQVCSETIREVIESGKPIPVAQNERLKLLSKSWSIRPMSYKQFTNLIEQKNAYYKALVKKNGAEDPLRKTLLIIDEAHKLYGGSDLSSLETPNMEKFQQALQHSYLYSGQDSVRLLLMTATPITTDPLEMVKLVNLCNPRTHHCPTDIHPFSALFLDDQGFFTPNGEAQFKDYLSGHISYLNREKDARTFAQPIVKTILTPIINENQYQKYDVLLSSTIIQKLVDAEKEVMKREKQATEKYANIQAKSFSFMDKLCEPYEQDAKSSKICKAIKRKTVKRFTDFIKDKRNEVKESVNIVKRKIHDLKSKRQDIRDTVDQLKAFQPVEIRQYKQSAFHQIKTDCVVRPKYKTFDDLPHIQELNEQIQQNKQAIQRIDEEYKEIPPLIRDLVKRELETLEQQRKGLAKTDSEAYARLTQAIQEKKRSIAKYIKQAKEEYNSFQLANKKKLKESVVKTRKNKKELYQSYQKYLKTTAKKRREEQRAERKMRPKPLFQEIDDLLDEDLKIWVKSQLEIAQQDLENQIQNNDEAFLKKEEDKIAKEEDRKRKAEEKKEKPKRKTLKKKSPVNK